MPELSSDDDQIMNNRIVNAYSEPLKLLVEPWYETFSIPPGENVIVSAKGPAGEGMEIVLSADGCVVWGWPGSSIIVLHKGETGIDVRHPRMPPTPVAGMRSLIESLWASDNGRDPSRH